MSLNSMKGNFQPPYCDFRCPCELCFWNRLDGAGGHFCVCKPDSYDVRHFASVTKLKTSRPLRRAHENSILTFFCDYPVALGAFMGESVNDYNKHSVWLRAEKKIEKMPNTDILYLSYSLSNSQSFKTPRALVHIPKRTKS